MATFEHEIYFDDSGTHAGSPIAIAACYVSSKTQWHEYNRNWTDVLLEEGLDSFHMADFMLHPTVGKKPFCNWDEEKRWRVYRKLSAVIRVRARKGFALAVPKDVYDKNAPEDLKQYYAKDHYAFAVKCCIGLIWKWRMQYKIATPMQYIFDRIQTGTGRKGEIMQIWKEMDADPDSTSKFGFVKEDGYQFQDKKVFKPLQAADILAWHMYDHMSNVILKGKSDVRDMRPTFMPLREDRPMDLGWFTEEQLIKWFQDMKRLEQKSGHSLNVVMYRGQLRKQGVSEEEQERRISELFRNPGMV